MAPGGRIGRGSMVRLAAFWLLICDFQSSHLVGLSTGRLWGRMASGAAVGSQPAPDPKVTPRSIRRAPEAELTPDS